MLVLIGSFSFEAEKSELKNCSSELVCFDVTILKNLVFFNNKHLPQKAGIPPEGGGGRGEVGHKVELTRYQMLSVTSKG